MSIPHTCDSCGHEMAVPERYAGKGLYCTACKRPFTVPSTTAPPAPPDASVPTPNPTACPACATPLPPSAAFCPTCGGVVGVMDRSGLLRRPVGVTALAILNGIAAGLTGLLALAVMLGAAEEEPALAAVLGTVFGVIAILQVAATVGLWMLRPWGRVIQIGLSSVGLLALPLGTLVSALVLWYMLRGRTRVLFSGKSPTDLAPAEVALLAQSTENAAVVVAVVIAAALLLVSVVGIVAAIAIPNLVNAVNRGRQKRTVVDMGRLGTAVESYAIDHDRYPAKAGSLEDLGRFLVPTYLDSLPAGDGWEHPLEVEFGETTYRIVSLGRDGQVGPRPGGTTTDYDDDIVFEDGQFVQWPEGTGP